jgi:hypothetical protein
MYLCCCRYYRSALDHLIGENFNLFVFSDDITWCQEHIQDILPTTVCQRQDVKLDRIDCKSGSQEDGLLGTPENLHPGVPVLVPHDGNTVYGNVTFISEHDDVQELLMMRLCQCNIIANSSFSWLVHFLNFSSPFSFQFVPPIQRCLNALLFRWAAYLNETKPSPVVIAPEKWSPKLT